MPAMIRIPVATLLGAIALYLWGAMSWVVLGLHDSSYQALPNEAVITPVMTAQIPEDGVYYFPGLAADAGEDAMTEWQERHKAGPIGQLVIQREGTDPLAPSVQVRGFLNALASVFLATLLLVAAAPSLRTYVNRVAFVVGLGLIAAMTADMKYQIFFYQPSEHTTMLVIDHVAGWCCAGLVLAAIIKRPPSSA